MKRYVLLILLLTLAETASADEMDGLEALDAMLVVALIGASSIVLLIVSILISIINRLVEKKWKANLGIALSSWALILCSCISIMILGDHIDGIFLTTCIGCIVLSALFLFLNNMAGQHNDSNENN